MIGARTAAGTVAFVLALALTPRIDAQSPSLESIVASASQYAAVFLSRFSNVVAEEHYVQNANPPFARERRELVADVLLVKSDETTGWRAFRDVFEVNRVAVRDHDDRLTRLFLESPSSAMTRAAAINHESARYNIGPIRTINNLFLPVAFLQDAYRSHFMFSLDGQDRINGTAVWILAFTETARPTLIRGSRDADLPARGRSWIAKQGGMIVKAELMTEDAVQRARITVTFRADERFEVRVPDQMEEEYRIRGRTVVTATAKYDRFRRFDVKTDERLK